MTNRPPADSARMFSQLRNSLIRALRASPEAREPLCDALELLETMQMITPTDPPSSSPGDAASRKKTRLQEYSIQVTSDGEFLVEHRTGHSQPFRCPHATYDAAATVLAEADDALHFDQLMERLTTRLGERQPDYRLRVALRFWITRQLVARFRTRYRAVERGNFTAAAADAWRAASPLLTANA